MTIRTTHFTELVNHLINKGLEGGLTATQITTILNSQSTALAAVTPAPTHGHTIRDLGPALNPTQPRNP